MKRRTLRALAGALLLAALTLRSSGCRRKAEPRPTATPPPGKAPAHWITPLVTPPPKVITFPPGVPTPDLRRVTLIPTEAG